MAAPIGKQGSNKLRQTYIGSSLLLFTKDLSPLLLRLVFPPRITKPSSASNQPTSRTWNLVPLGHTLETWLGTAPESTCLCMAAGKDMFAVWLYFELTGLSAFDSSSKRQEKKVS